MTKKCKLVFIRPFSVLLVVLLIVLLIPITELSVNAEETKFLQDMQLDEAGSDSMNDNCDDYYFDDTDTECFINTVDSTESDSCLDKEVIASVGANALEDVASTGSGETEKYVVTCTAGVKLRSSHSISSTEYLTLKNGTSFTVTEKYKDGGYYWGKTTYSGYTGWTALLKVDHSEVYSQVSGTYYHTLHAWVSSNGTTGTMATSPYCVGTTYYFWGRLYDPLFTSQEIPLTDVMPELTVNMTFSVTGPNSYSSSKTYNNCSENWYGITPGSNSAGTFSCKISTSGDAGNSTTVSFTINSYSVYFNANGGTVSQGSKTVINGATYGTLPTPSKTGCNFDGWYTSSSGGTRIYDSTKVLLTSNQNLYAHWSDYSSPSVSLSSTNNVASSQTVTIKLSDNVGIKGYYWGTSSTYSNNSYTSTSNTSVTKTVDALGTYYATAVDTAGNVSSNVSITFYKTTLNANGGSVSPTTVLTKYGNSFTFPTPSRSGYTYNGWSTSSSASSGVKSISPSSNTTYYAVWSYVDTENPTVSLSSTNNVASSQTVTIKLSDNVGIKGYYWGTSSSYYNNDYTSTSNTSVSKTVDASGTYYATAVDTSGNISSTVSITFYKTTLNANGGSVSPTTVLTKYGNSFTFPTPSRSGYTYNGWSTSSSASSGVKSISPSSNTTYYAVWSYVDTENPTVSLSSTNNVASSQTVTIKLSDNVGIKGYYWGTSSTYSNNSYTSTSSTSITKTIDTYGTYYVTAVDTSGNISSTVSITFYKTTLNANGGSVSPTSVLTKSGNSFTFPTPSGSGYSYNGWSTSSSSSSGVKSISPSSNTTYYAVWSYVDPENPTVSLASTNNVASSQTVTIKLNDNAGIKGYYWGTSSTYSNNSYTSTSSTSITKTVDASGTYYATAVDTSGNISSTVSITFYKTTLNANGGSVSLTSVLTKYGNSFTFPTPSRSGYTYNGWSTSSSASSGVKSLSPSSNTTYYAVWSYVDTENPTVSLASTNNVASSQTVTIRLSDNVGIKGYYWGTSSSYYNNDYTSTSSTSVSKTISSSGTYYATAVDTSGNISSTVSITFYKTTLNANGGSVSPTSVLTKYGNSFTFPTPSRSGYTYNGWATSNAAVKGIKSLKPSQNKAYFAAWKFNILASPKITKLVNTYSGVKLTWNKVNRAEKYRVFRKTGSGSFAKLVDTTALTYVDKTAKSGKKYAYTVRCISKSGKMYTSNYDKVGKSVLFCAAPKLEKIENGRNGVDLKWKKVVGAAAYHVYRYDGKTKKWKLIGTTTDSSFTDKAVKSGTRYSYKVRCLAKDKKTLSDYSQKAKTTIYIAPPKLTRIYNTKRGVTLTWNKAKGAVKYRVFRRNGTTGKWVALKDTTGASYLDKTARKGMYYQYIVRCVSNNGKTYTSDYKYIGKITCKR